MKRRVDSPKSKHRRNGPGAQRVAGTSQAGPALSPRRKWLFRLLAMTVLPLLAFGGLEAALRLAGYGYSAAFFKKMRVGEQEFLTPNDDFSLRFFPPELARTAGPMMMKARKPAGVCRIFILGESAAMGDPEPAYGAGRYLAALLRERFPETDWEVVNVAFTAINSHVIVPIARECAAQQGDMWIIYMGNNEMVGPFGAATVFGAKAPPIGLVRFGLAIQQTRLGQLLAALAQRLKARSSRPSSWAGMQMFLGNQVPPNASRKQTVYRNFQRNLQDILGAARDSGARIVLNTVAVNLKDCPPFASVTNTNLPAADGARFDQLFAEGVSLEGQGQFLEAARRYELASKLDSMSAELEFHWGDCLLQLTNSAAARQHYQSACDLDALPFRADSRINGLISQAARENAQPRLALFDAAAWMATNSPGGIAGQEAFYEHVHFNFDGNYRLALGWAGQVAAFFPGMMTNRAAASWAAQEACERRLGLTDWNRSLIAEGMVRRMGQPPLSAQSNNRRRVEALQSWVSDLRPRMDAAGVQKARELFREAVRLTPDDYELHESFATFLVATGDLAGAVAEWQRVHELIPQDYLANFRLGELLAQQHQPVEAQAALARAAALRPFITDPWCELGKIHRAEGKLEAALKEFIRARQLRPGEAEYCYQIGLTLALLNRRGEAIEQFRQAIELNPNYWQAHDALGGQLGLDGNVREARIEFERVTRLKPEYARAHLNLGVALLKQGLSSSAAVEFAETLRLEPTNSVAQDYLRQAQAAPKAE